MKTRLADDPARTMALRAALAGMGLLLVSGGALAAGADRTSVGVTPERLWLYVHLLLFVFWLGADLGVFLCSREVVQPGLLPEQRLRTARLMRAIDLAPRISASLMLTVGGILTEYAGITHPWWQMAGILALGPCWLTLILVGFLREGSVLGSGVARLDLVFRWLLVVAVPASVTWSWLTGRLEPAPYVAAKLLLFAAVILLGLLLRRQLLPFTEGLEQMARSTPAPGTEMAMVDSHARTRPLVLAIWLALVVAAWLGVTTPGAAGRQGAGERASASGSLQE